MSCLGYITIERDEHSVLRRVDHLFNSECVESQSVIDSSHVDVPAHLI